MVEITQHKKPDGDVEQSETYDHQSHDGTTAERHFQSAVKTLAGCVGSAGGSVCGSLHSEESGKSREETACEECERHPRVLHFQYVSHEGENDRKYDEHYGHDIVLLLEVSHRTTSHILCNLNHSGRTLIFLSHLAEEVPCHCQRYDRGGWHEPKYYWNVHRSNYLIR